MKRTLFALALAAGMLAGCSTGADETATTEETDPSDVTQEESAADVASTDNEESAAADEEGTGEDIMDEGASRESFYFQPVIPDEAITPEQWQDMNSIAYQLPEQLEDGQEFASLKDYLVSLKKSWQADSEFRQELPNDQFEEDSNLALSANAYLNSFADEAANLGIENEIDALKEAAFNLHRNFYGTHQEKLNETLRQDFEQRLNHVTDLLELG